MAIIDSFELINDGRKRPFITLRDRSITFSKSAIEAMKYPEFVHMFVDKKSRRVAFVPCGNDEAAIPFYKEPKEGMSILVRISGRKRALILMEIAQINNCSKGLRFYGEYVADENTLVIDMRTPQPT